MRVIRVVAAVFLLAAFSFATVTVSGNLKDLTGTAVTSRTYVRFWIRGCGGNQPRKNGTGVIVPNFYDLTPDASGIISGSLYDSLTEIECGGSVGATWYGVVLYRDGKAQAETPYNVTGTTFNLNSATPNSTSPVATAPTGDSTYVRLDGGNDPLTASIIGPGFQPTGDPTYNVKAYGALGNGTTDDTVAIQAAITAAVATSGTVFIPCGTFKITSQLSVSGNGRFAIQGAGDCSVISFDGSTVTTALGSPDTTQRNLIRIDNLHFISTTVGSGLAIDASHWTQSSIEHINAFGVNACVLMNNVHALYNVIFKIRCSVSGSSSYGMKFDSTANENTVTKARILTTSASTGVIVNSQGVKLYDVDVETGALIGIDVQASARTALISGAWLEGNQTNLQLASGSVGTTVIASEIDSGSVADITDNGATGTIMCGVRKTFVMQPCTLGSGLITANSNPASAGTIRMAVGDSLKFRNTANSADLTGLSVNGSDQMTVGSTAGIIAGPFISNSSANVPVNGILRMVKTDTIKFRNNAASADITAVSLDSSDRVVLGASLGVTVAGPLAPSTAGGQTAGTNALPFSSAYIGAAATNNAQITGTFTAARVHTLPDVTGNVEVRLSGSDAAVDLASVASAACTTERTVAVTGAAFGDAVQVMAGAALEAGTFLTGKVTSSGNTKWQFCNLSGGAVDRASDTYTIKVIK